jgi:hypothetical protein
MTVKIFIVAGIVIVAVGLFYSVILATKRK